MKYSNIPLAQSVVLHCRAKGIKNIIISPGSRNAPLTLGFTEDSFFKCFSIVDERCAAFFALGIAQKLKEPVAVVCTSGSALLNYYPAIAEAFYSDIPLVVLSADRPGYKIDVGDGQTIRQDHVFQRHIGYSAHLRQDVSHATDRVQRYAPQLLAEDTMENAQQKVQTYNDAELNTAINIAINRGLPVHINIPFEEPLYTVLEQPTVSPHIVKLTEEPVNSEEKIADFAKLWNVSARKMVLVGVNYPDSISQNFLDILALDPSVIVLTETTSNLHHPNFFTSIDSIVAPIATSEGKEELFSKLRPDVLLTFGGLIVSKKIKAFLRQYQPKEHWHVDKIKAYDTFFSLSYHFKMDVNSFFDKFSRSIKKSVKSDYFSFWDAIRDQYQIKRKEYIDQIPFSDMKAFHHITKSIPEGYQVQLANSSTVRYAQLFDMAPTLEVYCNRGTSGIDGSTSTAMGASQYHKAPTLLITGDLSFLYDSNGLWNAYMRPDFRIILINNQGGGIFRILPGQEGTANFDTYFETVHDIDLSHLCKMYGLEHYIAEDTPSLTNILADFYQKSIMPKILEVKTPRLLNNKILLGYFDFIS